jgi:hypothetical protein
MSGVPEELVTLPRDPYGPGSVGGRKQRSKKAKDAGVTPLGTISESRSGGTLSPEGFGIGGGMKSPSILSEQEDSSGSPPGDGKAKNGQINALAKLLRLHRNNN